MNLGLRPCLVPNLTEFSYNYIIYSKNTIKKNKASSPFLGTLSSATDYPSAFIFHKPEIKKTIVLCLLQSLQM